MSLVRLELLEVRLGSGRVYLVPRALLENLVQALPVSAPQLIVSASPSGGPLDPSGLPSQIDEDQGSAVLEPHEPRRPPLDSRCHPELAGLVAGARRNDLRRSKGFRAFQGRSRARQ